MGGAAPGGAGIAAAAEEGAREEAGVESVHVGVCEGEEGVEGREEDGCRGGGGKGVERGGRIGHGGVWILLRRVFRLGSTLDRLRGVR